MKCFVYNIYIMIYCMSDIS